MYSYHPMFEQPDALSSASGRRSLASLARSLKVEVTDLSAAMTRWGIPNEMDPAKNTHLLFDSDWLLEKHHVSKLSTWSLSTRVWCSWHLVRNRLDLLQVPHPPDVRPARLARQGWLRTQLVDLARPLECVADDLGVSTVTIVDAAADMGIEGPSNVTAHHMLTDPVWMHRRAHEPEWRLAAVLNAPLSQVKRARKLGFGKAYAPPKGAAKQIRRANTPLRARTLTSEQATSRYRPSDSDIPDIQCVVRALADHQTRSAAAESLDVDVAVLNSALNEHQVRVTADYILRNDPEWLKEKFVNEGLSQADIALQLGCTRSGVQHALRRHKIRRPNP